MAADWAEAQLRELAGTFSRRATAYRAKHHVPLIEARAGERKHELAEPQVPQDPPSRGLFPVITGNAPAPVWEVKHNAAGQITEARHRPKWPSVKHSDFHRLDPHWGQVTIRRCGDPPFGAPGIRTGHEWVERRSDGAARPRSCLHWISTTSTGERQWVGPLQPSAWPRKPFAPQRQFVEVRFSISD